jgi:hypothetical protein
MERVVVYHSMLSLMHKIQLVTVIKFRNLTTYNSAVSTYIYYISFYKYTILNFLEMKKINT